MNAFKCTWFATSLERSRQQFANGVQSILCAGVVFDAVHQQCTQTDGNARLMHGLNHRLNRRGHRLAQLPLVRLLTDAKFASQSRQFFHHE